MNNKFLATQIQLVSNSLFEAGKNVSKSTMWLLAVSFAIFLITNSAEPTNQINIPLISIKLSPQYAIGALLILFSLMYMRFVVSVNHEKYLYNKLKELHENENIHEKPWYCVYPGTINFFFYQQAIVKYKNPKPTMVFMASSLTLLSTLYPLYIIYRIYVNGIFSLFIVICLLISLLFYGYAKFLIKSHLDYDKEKKESNKTIKAEK